MKFCSFVYSHVDETSAASGASSVCEAPANTSTHVFAQRYSATFTGTRKQHKCIAPGRVLPVNDHLLILVTVHSNLLHTTGVIKYDRPNSNNKKTKNNSLQKKTDTPCVRAV